MENSCLYRHLRRIQNEVYVTITFIFILYTSLCLFTAKRPELISEPPVVLKELIDKTDSLFIKGTFYF